LRQYAFGLVVAWSFVVGAVFAVEMLDEWKQAWDVVQAKAESAIERDSSLLEWYAAAGGIYRDEAQGSSQDARHSPGRDPVLIDPVKLLRRVDQWTGTDVHVQSHLIGIKSTRSATTPDAWEQEAFKALSQGQSEVVGEERVGGTSSVRLMRPLTVSKDCRKCHVEQAYQVGQLRGAISVSYPLKPLNLFGQGEAIHRLIGYGSLWFLGVLGIAIGTRHLGAEADRRHRSEQKLQEAHDLLEQRVTQRTAELAKANEELQKEIEDRKQAERWLLESEERFRSYFESGLVGMAVVAPDQHWIEVNSRLCQILGYREEELLAKRWGDLSHPDDALAEAAFWERTLAGGTSGYSLDKRFLRKDGQVVYASISVKALRLGQGAVDSLLILVQDITPRKRAEESLRAVSARYETILSEIPDIILDVDANQVITWTNPAGIDFFGNDIMGKLVGVCWDDNAMTETLRPLFHGKQDVLRFESRQRRDDGQSRRLAWRCCALRDVEGRITGALLTARDVTDYDA
jgi:PAS domain S-box-containing protein